MLVIVEKSAFIISSHNYFDLIILLCKKVQHVVPRLALDFNVVLKSCQNTLFHFSELYPQAMKHQNNHLNKDGNVKVDGGVPSTSRRLNFSSSKIDPVDNRYYTKYLL
jgi:hypothetical protein